MASPGPNSLLLCRGANQEMPFEKSSFKASSMLDNYRRLPTGQRITSNITDVFCNILAGRQRQVSILFMITSCTFF